MTIISPNTNISAPTTIQTKAQELKPYIQKHQTNIAVIIILVLISTAATICAPYLIAEIIDKYISTRNLDGMNILLGALLVIYIIGALVNYYSTILVGYTSQEILLKIRNNLFEKVQNFPIQFFLSNKSGDIISRLNNDTRKLDNFLGQYIFEFISSFFTFIGIGVFIFFQNTQMALVAWSMVVILIIFSRIAGNLVSSASKTQLESASNITSFLEQNITNYKAVVAFDQQSNLNHEFTYLVNDNYKKSLRAKLLVGIFRPIYNFAGLISQIIVVLYGLYLISLGQITVGVLISFLLYTQRFYEPVNRLASVYASFQQALGAWSRIFEVIKLNPSAEILTLSQSPAHLERDFID